jgi:integrase
MKAPKLDHSEAVFLDDELARHVLELLDEEPIKWKTAMYLLIFSGIRRGELMGLEWKDIDYDNRVIHIRRTSQYVQHMGIITKSPKNETSYRTIKLSEIVFDLLREYHAYWNKLRNEMFDSWEHFITITLADGSTQTVINDRLFIKEDTTPMNPDSLTDWTSNFVKKNKLPHFTPHSLRHTHATLLIAEGVSIPTVSRRLGHSDITTTSKIYVHAIQSADEIASDVIDGKLNPVRNDKNKKDAK